MRSFGGWGLGQDGPKKDHMILECSLRDGFQIKGKNGIFYNFIDPFPHAEDAKSLGITIKNHMVDFTLI